MRAGEQAANRGSLGTVFFLWERRLGRREVLRLPPAIPRLPRPETREVAPARLAPHPFGPQPQLDPRGCPGPDVPVVPGRQVGAVAPGALRVNPTVRHQEVAEKSRVAIPAAGGIPPQPLQDRFLPRTGMRLPHTARAASGTLKRHQTRVLILPRPGANRTALAM